MKVNGSIAVSGSALLVDTGIVRLAAVHGLLDGVLQEAGDARGLQQQSLVVLHQQALVPGQVLQDPEELGALRTRQQNGSGRPTRPRLT